MARTTPPGSTTSSVAGVAAPLPVQSPATSLELPLPEHAPGRWVTAWQRFVHLHPRAFDALLAGLLFLVTASSFITAVRMGRAPLPPAWVWIADAIACGALLFRRRFPLQVLVVTASAFLLVQYVTLDVPLLILTVVAALVTLTLAGRRRAAVTAAVVITLLTMTIGTFTDAEYWSHPRPVAVAALCALSIAAAEAVRNRRAYVAAIEERARRAEESRDQEARRRVADERLRIARELHDVLAHHIAVINVQAGVAQHLLGRQPEKAMESLDHVRAAARSVLSEMQAVVSVLREPDETGGPAEPQPGLEQVDILIDRFRGLGLTIDTVIAGAVVPLPPTTDLVAYRVAQESLTNVGKHAPGARAEIRFDYRSDVLVLSVRNSRGTGPQTARTTGGFGLIGMRERVSSVGGALRAIARPDGGFETTATLPLHR